MPKNVQCAVQCTHTYIHKGVNVRTIFLTTAFSRLE